MDMLPITIMIVDSHCLILEGIKRLLEDVAEFKVIAAVQDGIAAMEQLKRQKLDVVLMDTQLPRQSGLETCRLITGKYPSTHVIMLTNDTNDFYLFEAIRAGAKGYLRKSISLQDLTKAIHTVYRKGTLLPLFAVQRDSHKGTHPNCGNTELLQDLTLREREILPFRGADHRPDCRIFLHQPQDCAQPLEPHLQKAWHQGSSTDYLVYVTETAKASFRVPTRNIVRRIRIGDWPLSEFDLNSE